MDPLSQQKFINYHLRLNEEEKQAQLTGEEGPMALQQKTGSAPVIRSANHKQDFSKNCSSSGQPHSPLKRRQSSEKSLISPKSFATSVMKPDEKANCNGAIEVVLDQMPLPTAPQDNNPEISVPSTAPQCTPPVAKSKELFTNETVQESASP